MATSDKYDRQLRLWGPEGQRALIESHILLVNADATGAETLKNLVLPGAGKFTVVDHKLVEPSDCGSNFFVTVDSVGQPRSIVVTRLLCEMNPDVQGFPVVANFSSLADDVTALVRLNRFTIVVLSNPSVVLLDAMSVLCWELGTPLVVVRTCGFLGYLRLQLREQHVMANANDLYDLRIYNAFPELREYCSKFDFATLSRIEYCHVPYIVILYQALEAWKEEHGGSIPSTFQEKKIFAASIDNHSRKDKSLDAMNFVEALNNAFRAYAPTHLPDQISELLQRLEPLPTTDMTDFRIMLIALRSFMAKHEGLVPLPGNIPDMTSTSEYFIQLQQIYHKKAEVDRTEFRNEVVNVLQLAGMGDRVISNELIEQFCRSVYSLGFVDNAAPIANNLLATPEAKLNKERVRNNLQMYFGDSFEDKEQTPIVWWFLVLAAERFELLYHRWPGTSVSDETSLLLEDARLLWGCLCAVVGEKVPSSSMLADTGPLRPILEAPVWDSVGQGAKGPETDISKKHCVEMVRFGNSVLHNIASVMGGVASQEVAKIITHKFVPLNNTFIFNGICGVAGTYDL